MADGPTKEGRPATVVMDGAFHEPHASIASPETLIKNYRLMTSNVNEASTKSLIWIYYNALNERRVAMRDGDWKVLAKFNIGKTTNVTSKNEAEVEAAVLSDFQIFKVTEDIGESNDLTVTMPDKAAELTQRLKERYAELLAGSHVWDAQ